VNAAQKKLAMPQTGVFDADSVLKLVEMQGSRSEVQDGIVRL
jgi:hypothetical protein